MKKLLAVSLVILIIMSLIVRFDYSRDKTLKSDSNPIVTKSDPYINNEQINNNKTTGETKNDQAQKSNDQENKVKKQDVEQVHKQNDTKNNIKVVQTDIADNKDIKASLLKHKLIALTFDDGPSPKYTMQILKALKKYNAYATFFVLGENSNQYKSVIQSIIKGGNQIGNHSYDHQRLTKLDNGRIKDELDKTNNIIKSIVNINPIVMRPTYGSVNKNVKLQSNMPLILWSVDTLDWKSRNKKMIINKVINKVKDGDIILMHDIYKPTADAAEVIIKELSAQGYKFVTINDLFKVKNIELVNGKVYSNAYTKKTKTSF